MDNNEFQRLQQGTLVKTRTILGRVYQPDYETGRVQITVFTPLRRRGQRARVNYQNVTVLEGKTLKQALEEVNWKW